MKPAQFVADANASGPSSGKPDESAVANFNIVKRMEGR
jgi:hypothetical protein